MLRVLSLGKHRKHLVPRHPYECEQIPTRFSESLPSQLELGHCAPFLNADAPLLVPTIRLRPVHSVKMRTSLTI